MVETGSRSSPSMAAKGDHAFPSPLAVVLLLLLLMASSTAQLQSSQAWSLLRIQRLLNYPPVLSSWNTSNYAAAPAADHLCYADPTPSLTVVCYDESITQLHIAGNAGSPPLPRGFSVDSLFTTLTRLPNLKVLSLASLGLWGPLPGKIARLSSLEILNLSSNFFSGALPAEISSLGSLQTLVLDHNMFGGRVPGWLGSLPRLAVISAENNSFSGPLPDHLSSMEALRVLVLSSNRLSGELPNLSGLTNLQVLELDDNYFGPRFPILGKKVATLVLRKNRFAGGIPPELTSSYHLLQRLDISYNRFVGPFLPGLLSLPSIRHLDIAGNRFTGMLFQNMSCNGGLEFVDLSSNLLTGSLPTCLGVDSRDTHVSYSMNCLTNKDQDQHPYAFCQNEALAVGVVPRKRKAASASKAILVVSVVLGVVGVVVLVSLLIISALRRVNAKRAMKRPPRRLIEHASNGYPAKLLSDARYISQTMKLGALGVPSYRSFSLEELEAATNNFETSTFMGKGSHGEMYRGRLTDGSLVAIRCLKLKKSHGSQNFTRHIELIVKLRHRHLVSALGHCFEYYLDDSTVSRLFLVFEYVPNGTLRSNICEGVAGQKLTWTQRISAAIGVAKGIQFLHAGIIPGLFANDLKTTNVLLDQNLAAKISSYNLPVIAENTRIEVPAGGSSNASKETNARAKHEEKIDIYDFGVILLEIISGRHVTSQSEVDIVKYQLQTSIAADGTTRRRNMVDPAVRRACSDESLRTVMDVCFRCLSKEPTQRPSVEDVLWNLQFAAQVQDAWRGDSLSSEGSPLSPSRPPQSPPP